MNIQDFVICVGGQFDGTGAIGLSADTPFRGIRGWDSITAMLVLATIAEEYNVTLTADDLKACDTIGDLFSLVCSRTT